MDNSWNLKKTKLIYNYFKVVLIIITIFTLIMP